MKKLYKILFAVTLGLFIAGVASASLGEYWSTISHLIPRTNDTVDIGSTAKRVRTLFINNLTCTDCVDDTNVDWGTGTNQVSSTDVPDHNGHSVRDTFVHIVNRGVAEAITVTLTGGLGVSWTTGEIYDRANHTFVATEAGSGNVTNNVVNYLKWTSGTTLTLSTTDATGDEVLIAIGSIYDGNINGYREMSLLDESLANIRRCSRAVFPTRVTSGMSTHEDTDATNPLDVTMDAGIYCKELQERITPIEIKSRNTAMVRHFHTAGVWDSDTNAQIETTNYDNGTQKTAIPSNKWVKGLFVYMNGKIGFVYPTECFNTTAEAQEGALPAMPTGLEPIPKLTAVVYQQGAVNFTGAIWQDVRAGISEESFAGVTDHGALAGLSDDDHTQYTLANGTRAFTGAQAFNDDIEMKDDKKLYFDTPKTYYAMYDNAADIFRIGSDPNVDEVMELGFSDNDGLILDVWNAFSNTVNIRATDGNDMDYFAKLSTSDLMYSDRLFNFPDAAGTFITSGNLSDITTVGTIGTGVWNGTALTSTYIGSNQILESHLKAVNAPTDEYVLTYESTTGDFEWQSVAGGGDIADVFDCTTGDCNTITVGTSEWLAYGTGYIDANRFAGVTTVDATEFGYLNGVTSAIQTQFAGKEGTLTNSAGLLAALSDETGTGLSVFSTSPTFTTPLLGTPTSGVLTNCTGTASGLTAGNVTTNANLTGDITSVGNATTITADVITHADIADSDQTDTKCFYLEDPVADDDLKSIWRNSTANNFLITEIWGESDQTVSFDLQIDDGTPADVSGTDIAPAAGEAEDTTLAGDTTLAASEELDLIITSVSGTPTWVSICFTGNWVD